MFIVNSYPLAVIFCVITMLCWGSWANTQKLTSKKWAFQLFYWDYAIGVLFLSLLFAFTLGTIGTDGRSFFSDLRQADSASLVMALLGGVIFNLSNILLVLAISIAGMAVAFPIGVGLGLVLGVIINYIGSPVGNPVLLFTGVALVVVAIILCAIAYMRKPSQEGGDITKGIVISIACGIFMGFFYRFVAESMSTEFVTPEVGKLTPYSASVVFSVGLLLSNFLWNTIIMYRPITGTRVTYKQYFTDGTPKLHLIGILGGVVWSIGFTLNIIASGQAGFAISYGLGQGATMIAALWGVFIWKEFKGVKGVNLLITLMFIFFVIGLGTIIIARMY